MNMLFLQGGGESFAIPRSDRRCDHILRVLKKKAGDGIEAGRSDGTLGQAVIESVDEAGLKLRFEASGPSPAPLPVRLLMGFPRPIQAGRILKDLTSMGAASIWFALSELGEKSYAESNFFKNREYSDFLVEGAEQCGVPRLPEVRTFWSLERALEALDSPEEHPSARAADSAAQETKPDAPGPRRLCLHPGPGLPSLSGLPGLGLPLTLALGSERGWTQGELALLAARDFVLCGLGPRVLKTETAAAASLAIVLSRFGSM
jgi:16S rRNA (uracil1498-N3)-methyltransferase